MTTARRSNRRIILAPYHMRVSAAREIAEGVGGMRIYPEGSRFRARRSDIIINWGRSNLPDFSNGTLCEVYNIAESVQTAINKARAWTQMLARGVPTVECTTQLDEALQWLDEGHTVLHRATLTGMGGHGITVLGTAGNRAIPATGTYVKYFKKRREFRVHVWENQMIDLQEKRKRRGVDADPHIRSYDNGWVFCRDGVTCPNAVAEAAIAAVRALGLQFGGVDVGWNEHYQRPCVFEVNTAPGIEGTTVERYVNKIKELVA